jgi:hypothetical protein
MRPARTFLLASVLTALLPGAGHATTIVTPPVIPDDDGDFFCLVTNTSVVRNLTVGIDVVDVNGGTSKHFGFLVPPLATRAAPGHGAKGDRVCRITVDGGRSSVRASVQLQSADAEIQSVFPVP